LLGLWPTRCREERRVKCEARDRSSWLRRSVGEPSRRQKYDIFEGIPSDEEEPIDYLETQIGLVSQLGEQPYLAQFVNQPDN